MVVSVDHIADLVDYDYQVDAGWTTQDYFEVKSRKEFVGYTYNGNDVKCELVVYKLKD